MNESKLVFSLPKVASPTALTFRGSNESGLRRGLPTTDDSAQTLDEPSAGTVRNSF